MLDEVEVFTAEESCRYALLEPFAVRLRQLAGPPLEGERDMLLGLFARLERSLRFHDTQDAAAWLRSGNPSPSTPSTPARRKPRPWASPGNARGGPAVAGAVPTADR